VSHLWFFFVVVVVVVVVVFIIDGQAVAIPSSSGVDRGFNLRAQAQYIPQLQQDKHFLEMVKDVEKFTNPDFIAVC